MSPNEFLKWAARATGGTVCLRRRRIRLPVLDCRCVVEFPASSSTTLGPPVLSIRYYRSSPDVPVADAHAALSEVLSALENAYNGRFPEAEAKLAEWRETHGRKWRLASIVHKRHIR